MQKRWIRDIRGGMSVAALRDYVRLWHALNGVVLNDEPDRFRWKWTASGDYTASSAYRAMFIGTVRSPTIPRIWKNWAPLRVKFFTWLALKKRLWTADRRRRHNLDAHDPCWLCDPEDETVDHLLVCCSYTKVIWWNLISWMNCTCSFHGPLILATHLVGSPARIAGPRPQERILFTLHVHHLGDLEGTQQTLVRGNELHRG